MGYKFSTIFRVSGLKKPITYDEVHSCLSKTRDASNLKVHFEILSIRNETQSFTVAARMKSFRGVLSSFFSNEDRQKFSKMLEKNGFYIRCALERHFPEQSIVSMEEDTDDKSSSKTENFSNDAIEGASVGVLSGIFNSFGRWYHGSNQNRSEEAKEEESKRGRRKRPRID